MKIGKIIKTNKKPEGGFLFRREGYKIYISYIDPKSINKINKNEYECMEYNYYGAIDSYEKLVNESIHLKYTIESELSLISKGILDSNNSEYLEYREFVNSCKDACKQVYSELALTKKEK